VDIEVILDAAESEAPGLRELARRFLAVEATHFGVPLDLAAVLARRAGASPRCTPRERLTSSSGT
jgi:hypothetical protein